jgi:hypothetical protein
VSPSSNSASNCAAVALELGAFVEDLAEGVLHHGDLRADADLAAQLSWM